MVVFFLILNIPSQAATQTKSPDFPNDPYYSSADMIRKGKEDQWGLRKIGLLPTKEPASAWNQWKDATAPIVIAVIDSGLDYNHPDFPKQNIWLNRFEIPDNGIDDDQNGYVDDVWGWNFLDNNNRPYDDNGHGTMVAGVIAAGIHNGIGIAGILPQVQIMPLKVMDFKGGLHSFEMVEAIYYAVANGARVINMSTAGKSQTNREQEAVDFARSKGVVVIAAAGNDGTDAKDYSPSSLNGVICVAATSWDDLQPTFSNFGEQVDLSAPGVEILSLRARGTDTNLSTAGPDYKKGTAIVGEDKQYYYASGTSLAAPFVSAVAAMILASKPSLSADQVDWMLTCSARDVQLPGWDVTSGYGVLDLPAALAASPDYHYKVRIAALEPEGNAMKAVGVAQSTQFEKYTLEIGYGQEPEKFRVISESKKPVADGVLGAVPFKEFNKKGLWTVRVVVHEKNGKKREGRKFINA